MAGQLLYLVHCAEDRELAKYVRSEILSSVPKLNVFLASKAGQIPTGGDWLTEIHKNLKSATTFLLLLTPRSLQRSWVWYEAGAAWRSGKRWLPVAGPGVDRNTIPPPLGAAQALVLDNPEEAAILFKDLGGVLENAEAFCRTVRTLALPPPSQLTEARVQEIKQAFGQFGDPVRAVLRRLLDGGLTADEMIVDLTPQRYPADPEYVERIVTALRQHDLVEGDADGRWRLKPELKETMRTCLYPKLSKRMVDLAQHLYSWVEGNDGMIDTNLWHQKFQPEINALRVKAENDHGVTDEWLTKQPSSGGGVRGIADALIRVAQRIP